MTNLKFVTKFVVITSFIFVLFYLGTNSYESLLKIGLSEYFFTFQNMFGLKQPTTLSANLIMLQVVSFFALIIVTPGIPLKRKTKFILVGFLLFFSIDLFFIILEVTFQNFMTQTMIFSDFLKLALPFSLWLIFSYSYLIEFYEQKK